MMKLNINTLFWLMFTVLAFAQNKQIIVQIIDQNSKAPLFGAVVNYNGNFFVSDSLGKVSFKIQKKKENHIDISYLGYEPVHKTISDTENHIVILMKQQTEVLGQIEVTSHIKSPYAHQVYQQVDAKVLEKNADQSLAKVLSSVSGVSMLQSGATVAKPIIHGLQGNRIAIFANNIKLESQLWGADHAPEIDPGMAQSITVIKGSDAIKYGSDALGGIILVSSGKLSYNSPIKSNVSVGYDSNGRKFSSSANIQGSFNKFPHFAWHVYANGKNGGDIRTASYHLNNTAMREYNFMTNFGWNFHHYAIEFLYSHFETELGVFSTAHTGNIDDFYRLYRQGVPYYITDFSRKITAPKQAVSHDMAKINSFYKDSVLGKFSLQYSWQLNHRREFSRRRLGRDAIASVDMELQTHSIDMDWKKKFASYFETELGVNITDQKNINKEGTGKTGLIPNFASRSVGVYSIEKFNKENWNTQIGLRYDYKNIDSKGYDFLGELYGGRNTFHNFTYHLSSSYRVNNSVLLKSEIGLAWRAPQVNELFSYGLHHGAGKFEIGDSQLKSERGYKWISSLEITPNNKWNIHTDLYFQRINNYIFSRPNQQTMTLFSGQYPIYKYQQEDAFFVGGDLDFSFQPTRAITYKNQISVIYAKSLKNGEYFPNIPPTEFVQEISWNHSFENLPIKDISLGLQHKYVAKQNRYTIAYEFPLDNRYISEVTEITPKAYHLFQISSNFNFNIYNQNFIVYFVIDNLFNTLYRDYNNRFRFFSHDMGRNIQSKIIYKF